MKVLFVGLGSIGQRHLRNLFKLLPDGFEAIAYRTTRLAPLILESGEVRGDIDVAKHYGITEFDSMEQALREKPNFVIVCNPNSLHMPIARAAVDSGCDLFIEKPLSHEMTGVRNLQREVEDRKLVVGVGYQYRFHPGVQLAKRWLNDGLIGNLVSADFVNGEYMPAWHPWEDYRQTYGARSELGGGATLSQIHEMDLAYWFFGMPCAVYAVGGQLSRLEMNVEDSVTALFRMNASNGAVPVTVHLDYLQSPPERSCRIVGDKGRIVWSEYAGTTSLELIEGEGSDHRVFENFERNEMFLSEMADFLVSMKTREAPKVGLQEAIASLTMAMKAKESIQTGDRVLFNSTG